MVTGDLARCVAGADLVIETIPEDLDLKLGLLERLDRLVSPRCSQRLAAAWKVPLALHPSAGHDLPLDDPDWLLAQLV